MKMYRFFLVAIENQPTPPHSGRGMVVLVRNLTHGLIPPAPRGGVSNPSHTMKSGILYSL